MQRFYEIMRWLYPVAHLELDICPDKHSVDDFVRALKFLLSSGREEALFIAIHCINEDRTSFALAIRNKDWLEKISNSSHKSSKLCEVVLASSKVLQILQEPNLLTRQERLQLRERIMPTLQCCLPMILWSSLCDVNAYKLIIQKDEPRQIAKLLYCYMLTFVPDENLILASSNAANFIKSIYPWQMLDGLPRNFERHKQYSRAVEARIRVIENLHPANHDH